MKRVLFLGTLLAGAYSLFAQPPMQPQQIPQSQQMPQSQQPQQPQQPAYPPGTPGAARSTDPATGDIPRDGTPVRIDDKAFLKRVAAGDLMQVELGKLAAEKGSTNEVKQYGRKISDERQKAHEEVTQLASKEGVTIPDALDSKHKGKVDKLAKLDGQNFDKAFLKEAAHDSGDDVADFQAEAKGGSDAAVQSFATRMLPMVQAQAQMAKDLQSGKHTQAGAN